MIVFGTKAVHLQTVELEDATCPSCGEQDTILLSVFRKHFHIFWIPILPIGKKGLAECAHCKRVMGYTEMSSEILQECNALKDKKRGPIWQYVGLVLIVGIIILSSFFEL
jgi:zinc-ribbon family